VVARSALGAAEAFFFLVAAMASAGMIGVDKVARAMSADMMERCMILPFL
jgi:hypothetical protein